MNINDFDINKVKFKDHTSDNYGGLHIEIKYERNGKDGYLALNSPIVRTDGSGVAPFKNKDGSITPGARHSIKVFFPRKRPIFIPDRDEQGNIIPGGHFEEPDMVPSNPEDPASPLVENNYEECEKFLDIFSQIYEKALDHCFSVRGKLKLTQYRDRNLMEAAIGDPIYRKPVSEEDPTEDLSYPPSLYLKLIESGPNGNPPNKIYTTFRGADNKIIDPKLLCDTMMYLAPVVRVSKIFIGGKKSGLQCNVTNAFVLDMKSREDISQNKELLDAAIEQNPGLLDAFVANIQRLSVEKNMPPNIEPEKQPLPVIIPGPLPENLGEPPVVEEEEVKEGNFENFMEERKLPVVRRPIKRQG